MNAVVRSSLGLLVAGALAGCGGGGGQSSGAPPVASPVPSASASAAAGSRSTTFAVSSIPSGLAVSYSNGALTAAAKTPTVLSPSASNVAFAITIVPTSGNALYTFVGDQRADGMRPVLYNQSADTSGTIASISSTSSAGRSSIALDAPTREALDARAAREPHLRSSGSRGRPSRSTTRVVVRYRVRDLRDPYVAAHGVRIGPLRAGVATVAFDVPADTTAGAYAARLRGDPAVEAAWPDLRYYAQTTTAVAPNDTHFSSYDQWSMYAIGAPNAWGYTEGSAAIAIAIVDTGLDFMQADFGGAKVTYAESDVNGVTTPGAASAQDSDGHGTNVAGIAAADTNNAFGFAGAGYNTSLQIYKVFPDDTAGNGYAAGANASDVTLAIYNAVNHGARIINLSLGGCAAHGSDPAQQDAIAYALAHEVVVVAAAGNERGGTSSDPLCGGAASTLDFPAAYDGVISVGATALDDVANPGVFATAKERVASYSNAGPGLSLVAPGGDPPDSEANGSVPPDLLHWIEGDYTTTAANPQGHCRVATDCKALFAGTSQSAPHVAGAAALLLAVDPSLSGARVRSLLLSNADDIGDPLQGGGRLDAYRALAALKADPAPPAVPTALDFVAFAYAPNGSTQPSILDVTYPAGVRVDRTGAFRIADVPSGTAYKIAVWDDVNGDGRIDSGDYFGTSGPCDASARCASANAISVFRVPAGFVPN